jgi:3D-(3,5/4)-trihydroxycyclohexane-1,2-dione acylhydrolase (decyclizing)
MRSPAFRGAGKCEHDGRGIPVDRNARVGGYESWWDVPVAETSSLDTVRKARAAYEEAVKKQRRFF